MKLSFAASCVFFLLVPVYAIEWERVVINAKSDFEAAGVLDVNRDKVLDIMCGDTWYEGPNWEPRRVCEIARLKTYRFDFANVPLDVNGDGWLDIVSCNWFDKSVVWRQNPGTKSDVDWIVHPVDSPSNMETALAVDVDADGKTDFLPNVSQKTCWYRVEKGKIVRYDLSSDQGGHGIGFGDVNGDGRKDILLTNGWLEAPEDRRVDKWSWRGEWKLKGFGSIGIFAHDFTGDRRADIVWGNGHGYGLFWLEQTADPDLSRKWRFHVLDESWSQAHAMRLVDLDADGSLDVVTGKRKYAHNGSDPGAEDPLIVCFYRFDKKTKSFQREVIHEGGDDGMALAPAIVDIDADGDLDIVSPGKSGLYLYKQLGKKK